MTTAPALSPLTIGNVSIGFPIVQAALSGYSDLPMRVIARQHGASYAICEVMLDQFLLALNKRQTTHLIIKNRLPVPGAPFMSRRDEPVQGTRIFQHPF